MASQQKTALMKKQQKPLLKKTHPQRKKSVQKRFQLPSWRSIGRIFAWPFVTAYKKLRRNRTEAAHKSFVRTRRRDKLKKPKIEGYIAFPWYVFRMLWNRKWVYIRCILILYILSAIFIGALQVDNISSVNTVIDSASSGSNVLGPVVRAAVTVGSSIGGALNNNLSDVQYIYSSALVIIGLLTVVWLLRHQLAGKKVQARDGLYNAAAPLTAEYVLVVVGIAQLIPAALATLIYVSATTSGILDGGIETAMFSLALFFVIVLTLYFMTTTLFAMFIATIPGTYPMKAYKAARHIVAGQRLRLLLRLLWMMVIVVVMAFIVLMPVVIIVNSFGGGNSWIIPIAYQLTVITGIVYATAYGYLLYRRMIDEPAQET